MTAASRSPMVAVAVAGDRNLTRISGSQPLSDRTLASFARTVAGKAPGKLYYVVEVSERGRQRKKGDPLYVWHVGEGFHHAEGWWTDAEV